MPETYIPGARQRPNPNHGPELRECVGDEMMRLDDRPRAALVAVLAANEVAHAEVIDRVLTACIQDRPSSIPVSLAGQLVAKQRMGVGHEDGNLEGGITVPSVPLDDALTPHALSALYEDALRAREELLDAETELKAAQFARDRFAEREAPSNPAVSFAEARTNRSFAYMVTALEVVFLATATTATGLLPERAFGLPSSVIALAGAVPIILALQAGWLSVIGGAR